MRAQCPRMTWWAWVTCHDPGQQAWISISPVTLLGRLVCPRPSFTGFTLRVLLGVHRAQSRMARVTGPSPEHSPPGGVQVC